MGSSEGSTLQSVGLHVMAEDGQPLLRLGDRDEVDLDAGGGAPRHLA